MNVSHGARAFLEGLVDYAGLFPPAKLSMPEAVREYARHRHEPLQWMLGPFICPASSLAEFAAEAKEHLAPPWRLSVLATPGARLADDLERVWELATANPNKVVAEAFELKITGDEGPLEDRLAGLVEQLDRAWPGDPPRVFFEMPWADAGDPFLKACALVLADLNRERTAPRHPVGLKFRTGGVDASAFPSIDHLAHALVVAAGAGVPFKATAGLHHPVRKFHASVEAHMHGFLNVFGAGLFAVSRRWDEAQVADMLRDEDASHFHLDEQGFRWLGQSLSPAEVRTAREGFALSYGSCSFVEPVDDLRALGML